MKRYNFTNVYGAIGKSLWVFSGSIIGLLMGGIPFMLIGALLGFLVGHFLDKAIVSPCAANE